MDNGEWISDLIDSDPFENLLQRFIDYWESTAGKLMTPNQLFETRQTLERLSEGSLRLAEAIVEQSIEKKWAKLYRLQDKQKEFEIKNSSINRQVPDDEIERQLLERSQKDIDKAVKDIRVEIFGSIDEYNNMSIKQRQERRRLWRQKVLM